MQRDKHLAEPVGQGRVCLQQVLLSERAQGKPKSLGRVALKVLKCSEEGESLSFNSRGKSVRTVGDS